jgi:hypothetical protein
VSILDKVSIEPLEEESMLGGQNVDPNLQASEPEIKICNIIVGR